MRLSALPAAIVVTAVIGAFPASALDRHSVHGIWRHPDTGSFIQIYACEGGICAKVASTADPNLKDIHNPDPALRSRPVAGVVLWRHPKESGDLQWIGSAYNTIDGGTYYGTMHLTSATTLAVSACNLSAMVCADQTWTRADPETAKAVLTQVSQPQTAPAAPTVVIEKPKQPPVMVAEKPKDPPSIAEAMPKQPPVAAAETPKVSPAIAHQKPKRPPVKIVEKPKAPPAIVVETPKEVPEKPRDPNGYEDLPHIHIAR
jgi:uncharacterized protein (DUF2147 family)